MTTNARVTEWVRYSTQGYVSICGTYRIATLSGRVIRYTVSDFPCRAWRHPVEFDSVELAMASV